MVEFTDMASVEAWCKTRPIAEIAVFAGLAAARVFPGISFETIRTDHDYDQDLRAARALLTSFVRGVSEEEAIKQAASSSSFVSASSFASSSSFAAASAASTAASAASASAASFFAASSSSFAASSAASVSAAAVSIATGSFASATATARHLKADGVSAAMSAPLWGSNMPKRLAGHWADMKKEQWADLAVWGFWIDWYDGLLEGRAPDWALWREVALIPNDVWEAGPEAVAEAIEGVKKKLAPPPLSPEIVTAQAKRLLAQPKTTALIANDAAAKILAAISEYMKLADANSLPEGLERLHNLPAILRGMAATSQSAERIAELEAQIVQLVGETLGLSRDVQGLRLALAAKADPSGWRIWKEQAIKTSAVLVVGGVLTTVLAAGSHLTGITGIETAFERLSDIASGILDADKASEVGGPAPFITPTIDV